MCDPVSAIIGAAVLGAGTSVYTASKASKQQAAAQKQNVQIAEGNAQRSEEQYNRANQKQPGIAAILQKNLNASGKGIGSTFLTGSKGVPSLAGMLGGRPSLLGGA
jgi:hypothetical protein